MLRIILTISLILLSFGSPFSQNKLKIPSNLLTIFWTEVCRKGCSDIELAEWKKDFEFKMRDLNGDNNPEYLLTINHTDWCGAGSNCNTWIYRRVEKSFRLIFNDKNPFVNSDLTNNFFKIESRTPMGFCDKNVQRFSVTNYIFKEIEYVSKGQSKTKCVTFTP